MQVKLNKYTLNTSIETQQLKQHYYKQNIQPGKPNKQLSRKQNNPKVNPTTKTKQLPANAKHQITSDNHNRQSINK